MKYKAKDIFYTDWEEIPLSRVKLLIQFLPFVRWDVYDNWANTYIKNIILKKIVRIQRLKDGTRPIDIYKKLTAEQKVDLIAHQLEFMKALSPRFLVPLFTLKGKTFHAPKAALTDITIERLAEADTRLSRYMMSEKKTYLHAFVACIYSDGSDFNDDILTANAALMEGLQEVEIVSIIRSYLGSREMIVKNFEEIFPSNVSDKPKKENAKIPRIQDTGPMWESLIQELANTPGFQGMATAKKANAWEALSYLNRELKKNRKAT